MEVIGKRISLPSTNKALAFAILLIACLAILWTLPKGLFKESDTFWLIEIGGNILQHRALPNVDTYSFASSPSHWILYQWLSEVIFALAHTFGLLGVSILGELLLALLLCVLLLRQTIKQGANSIVALFIIIIVTHATFPDIASLRPQLFSFVYLLLLENALYDAWSKELSKVENRWILAKTFAIGLLWVNCHVSFIIGLLMLLIYSAISAIRLVRMKEREPARLKLLTKMTLLFLCATLVNPYGTTIWLILSNLSHIYVVQEMQPLSWNQSNPYILVYGLFFVCMLCSFKKAVLPQILISITLFILGCLHARLIIYFCLYSCPLVARTVTEVLPSLLGKNRVAALSESVKAIASAKYYPAATALLSFVVVMCQPLYLPKDIPFQAAEHLSGMKSGNLFCSGHTASYLIYRFHGAIRVFVDTRLDLFDPSLCKRFEAAMSGKGWEELFNQYNITETLLPKLSPLNQAIEKKSDWKKIYEDDKFAISIREP